MSAKGSKLTDLLSTHNFKLVCAECCVQQNEITYTLKSVNHQCQCNLLLCKAKATGKWRPISRRPTFSNPSQYEVCWFFVEDSGCTKHKNRCTFARSSEEVTVWNFEKCQGLDHTSFVRLVSQNGRGSVQQNPAQVGDIESLADLLATVDLKAVCSSCSIKEKEITYTLKSVNHQCSRDLLLAKGNSSNQWRPISLRPSFKRPGQNARYQVCIYCKEDSGCTKHGETCTFARSHEESIVWNFEKDNSIDHDVLIGLVAESEVNAMQPQFIAENIFKEFSGEFLELCKDCFNGSPQKVTAKRWNGTCSADAAHTWNPVLVHHLSDSQGKDVYNQVHPLPPNCRFEYCSHVKQGRPCWHGPTQCHSAHSEVEMAVWKAEEDGMLIHQELLHLSQKQHTDPSPAAIYCKACLLVLTSHESFFKHCASLDHAQMMFEDTTITWSGRPPPHSRRAEFELCDRPDTCEYGNSCVKAHSVEELEEWLMRTKEEKEIRHNIRAEGLMSYGEKLLEEYRNSSNEVYIISEHVDDVTVICDEELFVECDEANARFQWNFQVKTERQLAHVALLKQEPGASFSLDETSSEPCTYCSGEPFQTTDMIYNITVSFKSINPGLYEQWFVLDFDMRPVLLQKLKVRVGQPSSVSIEEPSLNRGPSSQSLERWHRGNRVIIPYLDRTEEQEELLKEYKSPQMSFQYKPTDDNQTPLNHQNYKERMHSFLYNEELAEDQVVSRLSVCGEITMSATPHDEQFDLKNSQGELLCTVSVPCKLTPDTPEGFVLRQSVQSALIAPLSSDDRNRKVYEAIILHGAASENKMLLQLSKRCCSELALKSNETYEMEVQFQSNRLKFCEMHKAVDLLPDTKRVLPDFKKCGVPVNDTQYRQLNEKQQAATDFIIGDSDMRKEVAPLLIYGPFGTGKTFTLATAARELAQQPQNRVLICTHTNSSADLYVKDHFHPFIKLGHHGIKPLRIKANNKGTGLRATDEITLKYCLLSQDGEYFLPPTKAALDRHRIVITTTTMARHLHHLKLPDGYFTHILIDEASQMLECEALMPLGLAGPNTRVVLAGDHMQMGPKLFSVEDDQRSNHTLLNRLFHYYLAQKSDAAKESKIIFSGNYRSTKEIVDFVSTHFYVGKTDVIKAVGKVPGHPKDHPLKFHHVRGDCRLDPASMSWFNSAEVAKVVEVVQDILLNWPSLWGRKDQGSICVLSEGFQVRQIRQELRKRALGQVNVENITNVQGKQFRAVIMTGVHTRESLKSSHSPGLEFFNDARVLNTAMTRAQSQVVVVGDAAALCHFGKCSRIWKSYIDHCISKDSVEPEHLTEDFLENDIKEISKFHKSETQFVNIYTDAILQQLKEEYGQLESEYSSNEDALEFEPQKETSCNTGITQVEKGNLLESCKSNPNMYKQRQLVKGTFNTGYVIPFDNPTKSISVEGGGNLGKSFCDNEMVVETSHCDGITRRKVVGSTEKAESSRVFVCTMEEEDHSKPRGRSEEKFLRKMMIPISKNAPKICILVSKKSRNFIPIWEKIDGCWRIATHKSLDGELKQNHVFVVQVIRKEERCKFPLGNVIDILPIARSLDDGLRILDKEFKVEPVADVSIEDFPWTETKSGHRKDLCKLITFTIDPGTAKNLDDAISIMDSGEEYEVGVHIADVASFVNRGDALDEDAKRRGVTYYRQEKEPRYMFPKNLSRNCWSLLPGRDRQVVSLIVKVKKETDEIIGEPTFQLSQINSDRKLSYEEAEDIICKRSNEDPKFDTVEDCVTLAYRFAKAQRKARLADWAYSQPDNGQVPGNRKSHLMTKELNVLFNAYVSKYLISAEETMCCTPIRCQAAPDPDKVEKLKEKHGELIPLSFHVRRRIDCKKQDLDKQDQDKQDLDKQDQDKQDLNNRSFYVLTNIWNSIQSAAREGTDIDKIVDLIATDDIHPQLLPVVSQFRKCFGKAYFIRSNSSPEASIGHNSLNLKSYTQASSPIRQYIDVVLQRLLHTVICGTQVQYSTEEIDILCPQAERAIQKAKEYEQKVEMISFAMNMRKQNAAKLAFVVNADPERESFRVAFPFDKNIFPDSLPVMYRDLQLEDQPLYDSEGNHMTLKWRRRIYSIDTAQIRLEVKRLQNSSPCTELPLTTWIAIVKAIDEEDWDKALSLIMSADTKQLGKVKILPKYGEALQFKNDSCTFEDEHYVDLTVHLKSGDTLPVQMTSEIKQGYPTPTIQLVCIKPKFEVCVDHAHSPITCFSRFANHPSRPRYDDTHQYVDIWKPLCEMESAASAVGESDSIIIEDLVVNFSQDQGQRLKGSFYLPLTCIREWAIECNLAKSLLCIRKRGLKLTSTLDHSNEVDPINFTWVAHGVTCKVEEPKKSSTKQAKKVDFYVNHLPMETIPECVFQNDTPFTVELIPKLLPDIRKENAVINIVYANDLVQKIALGQHIPKAAEQYVVQRWQLMREEPPEGIPRLNKSQFEAVEKALNHNFTLIQGPPGTGKTIVGAYIVYWFFQLNSKTNRKQVDPKDKNKKEVILYCGPSNKSVDVVAEYLLRFGEKLKPLRVYSTQVEMLDYPYPGCSLQFSPRSRRQEHAKPELRSITLHHRIREKQNPFSAEIKAFDDRIQLALKKKAEEQTDEKKAEELTAEKKAEELTDEKKAEAPTDEKKAEELTDEKKAEELTDEKKAEELTDEKKAEELTAEKKAEKLTDEKKAEEPTAEKKAEELTDEKKAEELTAEKKAEKLTDEKKAEELTDEKKAEKLTDEKKAEELTDEKKAEELTAEKKAEKLTDEKKAEELTAEKKAEKLTDEKKAEEPTAEKKAEELTDEKKAEELTDEKKAEKLTDEKKAEELTDEKKAEKLTDEKKAEKLTDEKKAEELTDEKKAEKLTDEKKAEELTDEKKAEKLTDEKKAEKLTDEKKAEELTDEEESEELTDEEEDEELTDEEEGEELTDEEEGEELKDEEVEEYKQLLSKARKYELERHDIILCTCSAAATLTLTKTVSARQILIDECAMATEPQALIPLVCNNPEKIVLLGDHKQLRPIVKNPSVRKLGMAKSLFERYFKLYKQRAVMLDTQYRMHEDICKFPSEAYYGGLLKTEVVRPDSVLLADRKPKRIVFGDISGEEISLVVSTDKGNENSKANNAERDIVIRLAKSLVKKSKVEQKSIVILSPYNAQVSQIRAGLKKINMHKITVTTITKSQGSEWRYVIISTVRSLPGDEIKREPDGAWLSKHVGFVGDPNQINVGITRAKEGLCIIGNQELLSCSPAWRDLLSHYNVNNSVTKAEGISVQNRVA